MRCAQHGWPAPVFEEKADCDRNFEALTVRLLAARPALRPAIASHNIRSIASSATAVLIAHVAAHTEKIRLGAGGIMLPNHSPLVIAEQFGTLASLHPGRIDLGLGRAPGSDGRTAYVTEAKRMRLVQFRVDRPGLEWSRWRR